MNFSGRLVAFAATTDLQRSREFYSGTLGLELVSSGGFADVYDCGGTRLRVTVVESMAPAGYTVLGWDVDDLDTEVDSLRRAGVEFNDYEQLDLDEHAAWTSPDGTRVAWFRDPDGNVLSVAQHAG